MDEIVLAVASSSGFLPYPGRSAAPLSLDIRGYFHRGATMDLVTGVSFAVACPELFPDRRGYEDPEFRLMAGDLVAMTN